MYALPYYVFLWLHRAAIDARRKDRTWRFVAYSVAAGLLAGVLLGIGVFFTWFLLEVSLWWLAPVPAGLMALPVVAPLLARHVLVPAGRVKLARWCGYISRPGADAEGHALVVGAWAFLRRPTPAAEAYLIALRDERKPLGDCELIASAFIAAGKGDADTCRLLLRSLVDMVEHHPAARELAAEWLAVDAVERGDWAFELDAHAFPASPLTLLLEGVATRMHRPDTAPSVGEMTARWLVAPHRRRTWPLLAMRPPAPPPDATDSAPAPADAPVVGIESLPHAIAAHLAFASGPATKDAFATTVKAWDAALADGNTQAWLARRAIELGAPLGSVDRALRDVVTIVTDELSAAADRAKLPAIPSRGPVGDALGRRLRHGRLDALESGFAKWRDRRDDYMRRKDLSTGGAPERQRSSVDEWREFLALRAAYKDVCDAGGLELRRLAFPHAFSTGTSVSAWLWNEFDEYALSHAISRWLLDEALIVGDAQAIELGNNNCNLVVNTRLGPVRA